jgi:membrane-associated phospholipid phosphatase
MMHETLRARGSRLLMAAYVAVAAIATISTTAAGQQAARRDSARVDKTFFTKRDAVLSGIALVGSAAISVFDVRIANYMQSEGVQDGQSRHDLAHSLTVVNEMPLTVGAVLTYGVGRLTHQSTVADVGLHTTEALVLTTAIAELIRAPLGRVRPRVSQDDQYAFHWGTGFSNFDNRSFPSLHAAVAFATASALVGEIRERKPEANRYAAPLLYTAAMVPGLTRMYLNQHWASDVAAGSFLGALIGNKVVRYAHTHSRSKLDRILLGTAVVPDGRGGMMVAVALRP